MGGNYHFLVINDHFGGPSGHCGQILQKNPGKGQSPPPFLAMPGFWEHLVLQPLPYIQRWDQMSLSRVIFYQVEQRGEKIDSEQNAKARYVLVGFVIFVTM